MNMVNSRSRPEHMYPIPSLSGGYSNSSSTQTGGTTAMECEPLPPIQRHSHHQHRAAHRYQPAAARAAALMNYAPCSLPASADAMAGFYQPYAGQRNYTNSQDGATGKLQTASSSSNNQTERDDSPMVGVCVQQSPVAIH